MPRRYTASEGWWTQLMLENKQTFLGTPFAADLRGGIATPIYNRGNTLLGAGVVTGLR